MGDSPQNDSQNADSSASLGDPSTNVSSASEPSALLEAEKKAEQFRNDYLYLRAEFDNYKKHVIRERSELVKYGIERFAVELLAVIDNFDRARALQVTSENFPSFVTGIEMTAGEFKGLLQRFGISEVPSEDVAFDPNVHEALGAEERADLPEGQVARVLRKPYRLHDKLIRPGQVIVAKAATRKS